MKLRTSGKPHKVLYLSRGRYISGAQRQLLYLLEGLDRERFIPIVLSTEGGQFSEELQRLGIRCIVHPLAGWRKGKYLALRYLDAHYVSNLARREGVALVHSSDILLSEYMLWSARRANVPSVLHIRAPISRRTAENYRCSEATALVTISKRVEMRLSHLHLVPDDKIVLIHDAVDQQLFLRGESRSKGEALRRQYGANGEVLVGIVGRVEPNKKQFDFVEAAKEVLDRTGKNVVFLIVGEVRDRSYYGTIADYLKANGLQDRIRFTGRREDMAEVLSGLDVLVSLTGGSVRYEAMMCGTAVLCAWSRTREESYHIRDNETGLLVTEKTRGPVVTALLRLIEDAALRQRIGVNAQRWAREHLSHLTLIEDTQRLYEKLLKEWDRANHAQ